MKVFVSLPHPQSLTIQHYPEVLRIMDERHKQITYEGHELSLGYGKGRSQNTIDALLWYDLNVLSKGGRKVWASAAFDRGTSAHHNQRSGNQASSHELLIWQRLAGPKALLLRNRIWEREEAEGG